MRERSVIGRLPLLVQVPIALVAADSFWVLASSTGAPHGAFSFSRRASLAEDFRLALGWAQHPVAEALGRVATAIPLFFLGVNPLVVAPIAPFVALYAVFLHPNVRFGSAPCATSWPLCSFTDGTMRARARQGRRTSRRCSRSGTSSSGRSTSRTTSLERSAWKATMCPRPSSVKCAFRSANESMSLDHDRRERTTRADDESGRRERTTRADDESGRREPAFATARAPRPRFARLRGRPGLLRASPGRARAGATPGAFCGTPRGAPSRARRGWLGASAKPP